jgi:protein TonB
LPGVVETAPQWRFVPAHADGIPIPEIVAVTLVANPATGEMTDRPQVGTGGIQAPRKTRDVRPRYPQDAREAGEQGTVILSATIGRDGAVRSAVVMRSVSPRLDAAAIEAVLQWRFEPTEINGTPVEITMTVTVNTTRSDVRRQIGSASVNRY